MGISWYWAQYFCLETVGREPWAYDLNMSTLKSSTFCPAFHPISWNHIQVADGLWNHGHCSCILQLKRNVFTKHGSWRRAVANCKRLMLHASSLDWQRTTYLFATSKSNEQSLVSPYDSESFATIRFDFFGRIGAAWSYRSWTFWEPISNSTIYISLLFCSCYFMLCSCPILT